MKSNILLCLVLAPIAGCASYTEYSESGTIDAGSKSQSGPKTQQRDARALPRDVRDAELDGTVHDATDATVLDAAHADGSIEAGVPDARRFPHEHLSFDHVEDAEAFDFILPVPNSDPATWAWDFSSPNPSLVESVNVGAGPTTLPSGAMAIYRPESFSDVVVTVRIYSTDTGMAGIILRYTDITHYYRFWLNETNWGVDAIDGDQDRGVGCGGAICGGVFAHSWTPPGSIIQFKAVGSTLTATIDGRVMGTFTDSEFSRGRVGVVTRYLADSHFDDFDVQGTASN